jgi:uncharacterized protein
MSEVRDNKAASRLEIDVDGEIAFVDYERRGGEFIILHTEVPPAHRNGGIGARLADAAIATGRSEGLRLKVLCPFVRDYLRTHPAA